MSERKEQPGEGYTKIGAVMNFADMESVCHKLAETQRVHLSAITRLAAEINRATPTMTSLLKASKLTAEEIGNAARIAATAFPQVGTVESQMRLAGLWPVKDTVSHMTKAMSQIFTKALSGLGESYKSIAKAAMVKLPRFTSIADKLSEAFKETEKMKISALSSVVFSLSSIEEQRKQAENWQRLKDLVRKRLKGMGFKGDEFTDTVGDITPRHLMHYCTTEDPREFEEFVVTLMEMAIEKQDGETQIAFFRDFMGMEKVENIEGIHWETALNLIKGERWKERRAILRYLKKTIWDAPYQENHDYYRHRERRDGIRHEVSTVPLLKQSEERPEEIDKILHSMLEKPNLSLIVVETSDLHEHDKYICRLLAEGHTKTEIVNEFFNGDYDKWTSFRRRIVRRI